MHHWAELTLLGKWAHFLGDGKSAREHFCNEVSGWLLSTRLCGDNTSIGIGTKHSLEMDKSLKAAPSTPKKREFTQICALFTTIGGQLKQSLLQRERRFFPPEVRTLQILCPLCEKNPLFHTLHDSDFVSLQIVTLRIELEFYTSSLAFHTLSLCFRTSDITNESNICFCSSYTKDITMSMCKDKALVASVDVILLREGASPSPTLRLGLR